MFVRIVNNSLINSAAVSITREKLSTINVNIQYTRSRSTRGCRVIALASPLARASHLLLRLLMLREDVSAEFMSHVDGLLRAARRALVPDYLVLDLVLGLGETARRAKNEQL